MPRIWRPYIRLTCAQASSWQKDYEIYDHLERYKGQPKPAASQPAQKPMESEIPGTDAWIDTQALRRKAEARARAETRRAKVKPATRPEVQMTADCAASHLEEETINDQDPTVEEIYETAERLFQARLYFDRFAVRICPPKKARLEDWSGFWPREAATTLYEAMKARCDSLHSQVALGKSEQELKREISKSVFARLPPAEYWYLAAYIHDRETNSDKS